MLWRIGRDWDLQRARHGCKSEESRVIIMESVTSVIGWDGAERRKRNDVMGVMVFGGKNVVHNNGGREMA